MTFAIIARDPRSGLYGIALASRFFPAGAVCLNTEAGIGAASIQSLPNPPLGPRALGLLRLGYDAETVRDMLVRSDPGIEMRQLHLMDRHGRTAAFTGSGCVGWAGHRVVPGMSEVMKRSSPSRALTRVDFPTLGRPAMATRTTA